MDDLIAEGWYPDPDGKPCARFWDGEQWTEKTRPLQSVSQSASGTVRRSGSVFFDAASGLFHGDSASLMQLAVRAVADLNWTVVGADETSSSLRFETKMSWGSWSGVTCNLTFIEEQPGLWKVLGTGKQNVRGLQLVAFDNGEAKKKAAKAIRRMQEIADRHG